MTQEINIRKQVKSISGKTLVAKLKTAGWILHNVNGSHHVMKRNGVTVSIPVHSKELFGQMLRNLLSATGVIL